MRRVAAVGATVAREGIEFGVLSRAVAVGGQLVTIRGLGGVYEDLFMPLHGAHQAGNAACALAAVEGFFGAGGHGTLDEDAVRQAFASFASPGRLEVVRQGPTVVLDGAHNPHGVRAMVEAMQEAFSFQRLVGVVGCLSDKDVPGMLEGLEPLLDAVVCTQNSSPRAMPADELGALAVGIFGAERVEVVPRLDDALDAAIRISEEEPELVGTTGLGVLVTGSVVTVGDARRLLHR